MRKQKRLRIADPRSLRDCGPTVPSGLWIALFAGLLLAAGTAPALGADPDVQTIVDKANYVSYYQGADGRAQVRMTIVDKSGNKRNREMTILRRDDQGKDAKDADFTGDQKYYVYFHLPADVNKMVFLVHKKVKGEDDRTLYLPALDLIKPISSADKRTSFVGSHFFYEDVSGRGTVADTHTLAESSKTYYVVKNVPKDPKSVEFAYFKVWIHKATHLVTQTIYYDKNDKAYRKYQALNVKQIGGFWTVTQAKMTDLTDGSYTILDYSDVKYNVGLPDEIFSQRYLRRPPKEQLK